MVKIAIASMGDVDRDNDVFDDNAFNRTIAERGPNGTKEIWHLLDHGYSIRSAALSKPKELFIENRKLVMVSPYRDNWNWREVAWPGYVSGDINQHSVGFSTVSSQDTTVNGKTVRLIKEVILWEGSAVLWGANPNTPTQDVIKSYKNTVDREMKQPIEKRFEILFKDIKDGKYNPDNMGLLAIELKYLETYYYDLKKSKDLPDDTEDPTEECDDMEELMQAMKLFANNLKN